jgi:hypothetical protein
MIQLQILSLLFALTMLYWSYLSYRRRAIRFPELLFWVLTWAAFALVALFPASATVFVQALRVNRTMDLLTVVGFMLLWVVVFANHLENRRLRKRLQELVRELALRDAEK